MVRVSCFGLLLAAVFFAASLTPSMMPRDPVMQGALGGVLAFLGYGIGVAAIALWRFMKVPGLSPESRRVACLVLSALALAAAAIGLWKAADWQNVTRAAIGLEPIYASAPVTIAAIALGVFLVLRLVAYLFAFALRHLNRRLARIVPERVSAVIGFALVLWLFWAAIDGALVQTLFRMADASFKAADALIEPDVPQPADPLKTGSEASLIRWKEMGRRGREFVATGPTREEIAEFFGDGAMEPIRVMSAGGPPTRTASEPSLPFAN